MSKPVAIILLVLIALILFFLIKFLMPSIKMYIIRMPKGIIIILIALIIVSAVYLVNFLIYGSSTGGVQGQDTPGEETVEKNAWTTPTPEALEEKQRVIRENCVVLSGSDVFIENEKADLKTLDAYLEYRKDNNILVTIVDDYSTAALVRDIKAVCEKKGVRYIIENETWIE